MPESPHNPAGERNCHYEKPPATLVEYRNNHIRSSGADRRLCLAFVSKTACARPAGPTRILAGHRQRAAAHDADGASIVARPIFPIVHNYLNFGGRCRTDGGARIDGTPGVFRHTFRILSPRAFLGRNKRKIGRGAQPAQLWLPGLRRRCFGGRRGDLLQLRRQIVGQLDLPGVPPIEQQPRQVGPQGAFLLLLGLPVAWTVARFAIPVATNSSVAASSAK